MKTWVWILTIFFPAFVLAAPTPISAGIYSFQDFSVRAKKRYETVYSASAPGKERLKELRQNKYICEHKGREIFLCSVFMPTLGTETEIAVQVQKKLSGAVLEFSEAQSEPELISESELLNEWKIPQAVSFDGSHYPYYRFLQSPDLDRIFLGNPAEHSFITDELGNLSYSTQMTLTESRISYWVYWILASYR